MHRYILSFAVCFGCLFVLHLQAADKTPHIEFKGHTGTVNFAAFSPDGTKIVTAGVDNTARIWNAETGKELRKLEGHTDEVNTAFFSPDGKKIVTASWDHSARIWDAESGKELLKFTGRDGLYHYYRLQPLTIISGVEPRKSIRFASFSPDGKEILVALNLTVRILDAESGAERRRLMHLPGAIGKSGRAPSFSISSAMFSPDGKKIVTGAGGGRVWDAKSGTELPYLSYSGGAKYATFSPDGTKIAMGVGTVDGVQIFDADSGKQLHRFNRSTQKKLV